MSINEGLDQLKLTDVVDLDFLQEVQDDFSNSLGMAIVTNDMEGKSITKPSGFCDFCMKLTRSTPKGVERCRECGRRGGDQAARSGKPAVYECHVGLTDFAAPIIIDGKQVGTIVGGQVKTQDLNESTLRRAATEMGIDPDEYVNASRNINELPRDCAEAAAGMLELIADCISTVGVYKVRLNAVAGFINDKLANISASMEELTATANNVSTNQSELNVGIQRVNEISGKINDFTSLIKDIAKQTRLLGLNASIEAARAGTAGAGFSVVAEEIGKLAGNSSDTVDKIQEITARVTIAVNETVQKGEETAAIIGKQTAAIENATQELIDLSMSASDLYDLAK